MRVLPRKPKKMWSGGRFFNVGYVKANLGSKGLGRFKFLRRAEKTGEFQVHFLSRKCTCKANQVGFRVAFLSPKSRLRSKVDGSRESFPIGQMGAARVDAIGRQALVLGLQIGRREAQAGPATRPRAHGAKKGERPAEHCRGIVELTSRDGGAQPAAADPFPGKNHRVRIIEEDFFPLTPAAQKIDIAGSIFSKPPIRADRNRPERGKRGGQFLQKVRRLLPGAVRIKRQGDHGSDLPPPENAEFVGQAGDEGRMFFGVKDRERMVTKREDGGMGGGMGFFPSKNDATVAEVQAVKKTQGEMTDGFSQGGGDEGIEDGHVRRMREISGREIRCRAR